MISEVLISLHEAPEFKWTRALYEEQIRRSVYVHICDSEHNFAGFSPSLGQCFKEFAVHIRRCILLGGFLGNCKGMGLARPTSIGKFNCVAIWTSFGEFL